MLASWAPIDPRIHFESLSIVQQGGRPRVVIVAVVVFVVVFILLSNIRMR